MTRKNIYEILRADQDAKRKAARAARRQQLRHDSMDALERSKEAATIRRGMRMDAAITVAEQAAAGAALASANAVPPAAEVGYDNESNYLIHANNSSTSYELEIDRLSERMDRAAKAKQRTNAMSAFLWDSHGYLAQRLATCNTYRVIRHYLASGDCRLISAYCCHQDKLCPVCASLRAGRLVAKYAKRVMKLRAMHPHWSEWMWTFTVKDGDNLPERLEHLRRGLRLLIDHRRKYRAATGGRNEFMPFCSVAAGVYSVEITIGKNSGQWHPHAHVYSLCDSQPDVIGTRSPAMEQWWERRLGDSKVVDVRPVHSHQERGEGLLEVLKYALKFSSMSLEQTFHAWEATKKKRLMQSFGELQGVGDVDSLLDDLSDDEGAYVDMCFAYVNGEYEQREAQNLTA